MNRFSVCGVADKIFTPFFRSHFSVSSDDASALWIDGVAVILDDVPHSYRTRSAAVPLSVGLHDVAVGFYENTGTAGLRLSWTPPGGTETLLPASAVFHVEPASYAPGVRLAAPDPAVCYVGNEVAHSATAWGFGEDVARVDFFADGALLSSVSNAPFATAWETSATGTVAVSAVATDSAGASSVPAVRTVEVLPCPPGYASGLSSTYYALSTSPGALPDFSLLTPCQTRIEHAVNHAEATSWPGVPVSATRLFASRHAGRLFVPATGDWTFLLESAEGSRLFIDGALVVEEDALGCPCFRCESASIGQYLARMSITVSTSLSRCTSSMTRAFLKGNCLSLYRSVTDLPLVMEARVSTATPAILPENSSGLAA